MSTRIIVALAIALCVTAVAQPCSAEHTIRFDLRFGEVNMVHTPAGMLLEVPGAPHRLRRENWPELPYALVTRQMPLGSKITGVSIQTAPTRRILLSTPLAAGAGVRIVSQPDRRISYKPFEAVGLYPEQQVTWTLHGELDPITMKHRALLVMRVFPVRYEDAAVISSCTSMDIRIQYEEPLVSHPTGASRMEDDEPFVIVAPGDFQGVIEPFMVYKNGTGLATSFHTIESILAGYAGRDDAEKLRTFIRAKVEEHGTGFVLLAGDADVMPVRRCLQEDLLNIPSDLYFSDLYDGAGEFVTWDHDNDGIFGRYPADLPAMDFIPDVMVSRIPASTAAELQTALAHSMQYEGSTSPQDAWYNKVLLTAVDTFNYEDHGDTSGIPEGERFAELLLDEMFTGMESIRLYETDVYPHDGPAVPAAVLTNIAGGAGFMAFHCHGAPDCFWLIDECFNHDHTDAMVNGDRLPIVFGFACSTAQFDNELPDGRGMTRDDESMPEHFLFNPHGGALAFVGATRYAFASGMSSGDKYDGSGALEYAFFNSYFAGARTPAQMMAWAQRYYLINSGINDYYDMHNIIEYAMFGDPTASAGGLAGSPRLAVESSEWVENEGDGDTCFEGQETYALSPVLINTGLLIENVTATLACADPAVVIQSGAATYGDIGRGILARPVTPFVLTTAAGVIPPHSADLQLTLLADGVPVHYELITRYLGAGPMVTVTDQAVAWDSSDNGTIDPGDTVYLQLILYNGGCETVQEADLDFTIDSSYVYDCGSYDTGVTIRPGFGAQSGWAGIVFTVSGDCPHDTPLPLHVTVTAANGGPWQADLELLVTDTLGPAIDDHSAAPRSIRVGQAVEIRCRAEDVSGVASVQAEFTAVTGGARFTVELHDDGEHGDGAAGDGLYGSLFSPPEPPSDYLGHLRAEDDLGNVKLYSEAVNITSVPFIPADNVVLDYSPDETALAAITAALDALAVDHVAWDPRFRGDPDQTAYTELRDRTLIWTFGWEHFPAADVREALTAFTDGGGSVMLAGWDVGRNVHRDGGDEWLNDFAGVEQAGGDTGSNYVDGLSDDPLFSGMSLRLRTSYEGSLELKPDFVQTLEPAVTGAGFRDVPGAAGVVYREFSYGRVMFLPFALEGVRFEDMLQDLLSRSLPWLADHAPGPTPTPAPSPTPTAAPCIDTGVTMLMPRTVFRPGDTCYCAALVCNAAADSLAGHPLVVVLDVYGTYFFGPSFGNGFDTYLESWPEFPPGETVVLALEPFTWPEDAGAASGIRWYGGLLTADMSDLFGSVGVFEFGWEE
ncbi:hypothetical protein JW905_17905 [bacterium]|nr:hypothetical protein [candidate division CSSED10-310 bacterium]